MKLKSFNLVPIFIAVCTIALTCFFRSPFFTERFDLLEKLEWLTYDQRVKAAQKFPRPVSTNLAAVFLDEATVQMLTDTAWPYPREMHGRLVRELSNQKAKAVGFDVLFGELRPYDTQVLLPNQSLIESDEFFAQEMRQAGNTVLAAETEIYPPPLFATNAFAVGDIVAASDSDGVLRRAKAFTDDPVHGRRWHMGIILAARELGLDLQNPVITARSILLRGNSVERRIPIDADGYFLIDWNLTWNDPQLFKLPYGFVIALDEIRREGTREDYLEVLKIFAEEQGSAPLAEKPFENKLVVVGSILVGNNLTDRGATPINKQDFLVSKHWNVANSLLMGSFIRRAAWPMEFLLIFVMGILSAILTWKLKAVSASISVVAIIAVYVALAFFAFIQFRYWVPVALPVLGALLMTHVCMVTYRVKVEQKERRRVKAVFSRMVSRQVMDVVLSAEKLSLGGARHKITVFFADVRGFTEMTDAHQSQAEEFVLRNHLNGAEAEAYYDAQAKETLDTVNVYLGTISDKITEYNGTLDKYIGDCVMAYWGAPVPDPQHALHCVRAAIASQRAIYALNEKRTQENQLREVENISRAASGQAPLPKLALLALGTGINTGIVIAGMMGSATHELSYTVFGREVNLASRLEGVSGRGRIIIGEATFQEIQRDDPQLAATCAELPSVTVKGIKNAVKIYEVPWKIDPDLSGMATAKMSSAHSVKS